ncbi:MAG TPA: hypothetical protein VE359_15245, partial [Vicinamibacteria bacterium]|nr:hypothetical protein [Vicinamibacteria bacterium]
QPPTATLGVGLFAGGIGWLAAGLLWAAVKAWRERAALADAVAGRPPVDGKAAVLTGRLEPMGKKVTAPLDGAECLVYAYEILVDRGSGKRRTIAPCYRGSALAPSAIVTAAGTYRLLAVPDLDGVEPAALSEATALARATEYVRHTTFRPRTTSARELEERWCDDDGAYRADVSYVEGAAVDLAACRLVQRHVRPSAPVCVFGLYSETRGGIVPHPNWGRPTRLMVGDAARVAADLGASAVRRLAVGLLAGAAAAGLVAAFLSR